MRTRLITSSNDAKIGARLTGIESIVVGEDDDVLAILKETLKDAEIGLILLTDELVDAIYQEVMELKLNSKKTMILTIPNAGEPFKDHIADYVRESIGIKY